MMFKQMICSLFGQSYELRSHRILFGIKNCKNGCPTVCFGRQTIKGSQLRRRTWYVLNVEIQNLKRDVCQSLFWENERHALLEFFPARMLIHWTVFQTLKSGNFKNCLLRVTLLCNTVRIKNTWTTEINWHTCTHTIWILNMWHVGSFWSVYTQCS